MMGVVTAIKGGPSRLPSALRASPKGAPLRGAGCVR